jgi:hypothetical protein
MRFSAESRYIVCGRNMEPLMTPSGANPSSSAFIRAMDRNISPEPKASTAATASCPEISTRRTVRPL